MPALIHFYENEQHDFTWIGPKWIYEIVTCYVIEKSDLSGPLKQEFDYYRYNHYIDFSEIENLELYDFKSMIHDIFDLVDSGGLSVFDRKRALISLGYMIELIVRALDFRGFDDEPKTNRQETVP